MRKVLSKQFFERSVLEVAPDLIGKYLIRKIGHKIYAAKITEVEAYDGPEDLACHASKGRTKRTEMLYGEAGIWYVYLIYGMYHMLNIVTDTKEYPSAVLIRAIEEKTGPGVLTRYLQVNMSLNGKKANKNTGLWIEDRGDTINTFYIKTTPRIGVGYAGPIWAYKHYRFVLLGSSADLKKRPHLHLKDKVKKTNFQQLL